MCPGFWVHITICEFAALFFMIFFWAGLEKTASAQKKEEKTSGQNSKNGKCPEERRENFWAGPEKPHVPRRKKRKLLGRARKTTSAQKKEEKTSGQDLKNGMRPEEGRENFWAGLEKRHAPRRKKIRGRGGASLEPHCENLFYGGNR